MVRALGVEPKTELENKIREFLIKHRAVDEETAVGRTELRASVAQRVALADFNRTLGEMWAGGMVCEAKIETTGRPKQVVFLAEGGE